MFITAPLVGAWLSILAVTPAVASAATAHKTVVVTSESTSNSSVVVNGTEVREGSQNAEVHITSVVNGETVIDIHETSSGEPVAIEQTVETNTGHSRASVLLNTTDKSSASVAIEETDVDTSQSNAPETSTQHTRSITSTITNANGTDAEEREERQQSFINYFFATFTHTFRHVVSLFT